MAGSCAHGTETWGIIKDWNSHHQMVDLTLVFCFAPNVLVAVTFVYKQKHHILHNRYQLPLFFLYLEVHNVF